MAFRPISEQSEVPSSGTNESSGFSPLDPVAASRLSAAPSLQQLILEKNAGNFPVQPSGSQQDAAFARGVLNSALAGTPEAGANLAGMNPSFDPNAPKFTDPYDYALGETVGSFLPIGRLKQAGSGLMNLVKEGARLGGVYGAGQGVSKAVQEDNPTLSRAISEGSTEGLAGAALGGAIPAVAGIATKIIPTKQNILSDLLKISSSDEGKMQRSSSGGYVQASDKVTPFIKEKGVPGFLDAAQDALDKEASIFKPIIKNAPPIDPHSIYTIADQELAKLEPNADTRRKLLLEQGEIFDDLVKTTNDNILQFAGKANREIGRIYKNPSSPITSSELAAKEAIRDAYGTTIRNILQDAGQDPSVYSGYGAIKELSSEIGKNYLKAGEKLSAQKGKSLIQNTIEGLEANGSGLNVGRALQGSLSKITEGEVGRMDNQINRLNQTNIPIPLVGSPVSSALASRVGTDAEKTAKLNELLMMINSINKGAGLSTLDSLISQPR